MSGYRQGFALDDNDPYANYALGQPQHGAQSHDYVSPIHMPEAAQGSSTDLAALSLEAAQAHAVHHGGLDPHGMAPPTLAQTYSSPHDFTFRQTISPFTEQAATSRPGYHEQHAGFPTAQQVPRPQQQPQHQYAPGGVRKRPRMPSEVGQVAIPVRRAIAEEHQNSPVSPHDLPYIPQPFHSHGMPATRSSKMARLGDATGAEAEGAESVIGAAPSMLGRPDMPAPARRPPGSKAKFTPEDDALLMHLKEGKNLTWKQIADFFPGRSSGTLQVRYCTKLKAKTMQWSEETIQKLREALHEYETERWRIVSQKVGQGFSAAACRDKAQELDMLGRHEPGESDPE